jgi:hypothetical protein
MTAKNDHPANWIRAVQRIRKLDLSFQEKLVRLNASHERLGVSDEAFEYGLLKVAEDFRTCSECAEQVADNFWNFEYLGGGKRDSVCRECRSAIRLRTIAEQRKANELFQLTEEQQSFLDKHNISFDRVFFANGMGLSQYRPIMKAGGYEVVVGATACERAGHSLRNRKGDCIQCRPASLAFERRHEAPAFVYIALSPNSGLIKVGLATDAAEREKMLKQSAYGGFSDWFIVESVYCETAGKVESDVHKRLQPYKYDAAYRKQGAWVDCRELFDCDVEVASDALHDIIG